MRSNEKGDFMDAKYLIAGAVVALGLWGAYDKGYEQAETEATLKIESMKLDHANQIIEAQNKEKERYEQKEKDLVARYDADRKHYVDRMRQLERKLNAKGDVEAVRSERDRCFGLAVRGERLLRRADAIIESLE